MLLEHIWVFYAILMGCGETLKCFIELAFEAMDAVDLQVLN